MKAAYILEMAMMINKIKNILLCCFWGALSLTLAAQQDFNQWSTIDFQYNFNKRNAVWVSNEMRLNENASQFSKYNFDAGYDRKIWEKLYAGVSFRYSRVNDKFVYKNGYDYNLYAEYEFSYQRYSLDVKIRFQHTSQGIDLETIEEVENVWRNKADISYKIPYTHLSPYIAFEYFSEITDKGLWPQKYRLFGGVKYNINKSSAISAYYGLQYSLRKPNENYILGLKYSLKLKAKKNKDKEEDTSENEE
ncbi:MAG TPA: DUF2490 domain-containing protein [Bacteroidales bacterium]|nr:DUF2490 domain-containing protein [Bacteroidales bacterium]